MLHVIKTSFFYIYVTAYALLSMTTMHSMEKQLSKQPLPYAVQYGPWRDAYLMHVGEKKPSQTCTFCRLHTTENNADEYILYKGDYSYLTLNLSPYINEGHHLLLIPYAHEKQYTDLSQEARDELDTITQKVTELFCEQAHEIHINFNIGKNATASIPDHIHEHIIINNTPRSYNLVEALQSTVLPPLDNETQYRTLLPLFETPITTKQHKSLLAQHDQDCYYCKITQSILNLQHAGNQNSLNEFCSKNLVIHNSTHATLLFDHHPFSPGDIIIIPHGHYTNRRDMPSSLLTDMRSLLTKTYPFLLSLFQTDDANMGMITYGEKETEPQHIRYQITPRTGVPTISPVTHTHYIHTNIRRIYEQLVEKFKTDGS